MTLIFWALSKPYKSKCRDTNRRHRIMVDSALESWWFICLSSEKIFTVRTHPQEVCVVKWILNNQISMHCGIQWGQQNGVDQVLPNMGWVFLWLQRNFGYDVCALKNRIEQSERMSHYFRRKQQVMGFLGFVEKEVDSSTNVKNVDFV